MAQRKTVKVGQLRVGDRLEAWMGEPRVEARPRLVGDWWKVKTSRGDIALARQGSLECGVAFVGVLRGLAVVLALGWASVAQAAADVVIDDALVVKGRAPVVEVCRRVPLKNGRVGETVVVCERVRGGK